MPQPFPNSLRNDLVIDNADKILHLETLVAKLRREVQDLRAATEIVVYDIGGEYVALAGRRTGFGETVNEAIGDLVNLHPGKFNVKVTITEKPE